MMLLLVGGRGGVYYKENLEEISVVPENYQYYSKVESPQPYNDLSWQDDSLCAQTDPEAFFPEVGGSSADPKKVCAKCDVGLQCLHFALATDEKSGIFGGMTYLQRKKLLGKTRAEIALAYEVADKRNKNLK